MVGTASKRDERKTKERLGLVRVISIFLINDRGRLASLFSLTRRTRLGRWGLSESARIWLVTVSWRQHAQNCQARGAGTRPVSWRRHAQNRLARGAGTLPVSWRRHAQNRLVRGAGTLPVSWRRHAQNYRARGASTSRTYAPSSLALLQHHVRTW